MKINSHNEWDTLKEVIVGTGEHMTVGLEFPEGKTVTAEAFAEAACIAKRALPDWYRDEVSEDLGDLCKVLKQFGASVIRPDNYGAEKLFCTPDWCASGRDLYNVRDLHLIVGDKVIASSTSARTRQYEPNSLQSVWYRYFEEGFTWISAPKPRLIGNYVIPYYRVGEELVTEEDIIHRQLSGGRGEIWHRLIEDEILFDAANVMRFGKDVIYLISSTGNNMGAKWLQSILGVEYKVHTTAVYRSSHLDSTILPLRPGLVLLNGARVNPQNCPEMLKKWETIYFNDMAPVSEQELNFQKDVRDNVYKELKELGVETDLNQMSSPWAGLNVLSLDQHTVLVHDRQIKLIEELEKHKLTVIPIRLRHTYTILGGLHCATLDTVRDSKLENYFDKMNINMADKQNQSGGSVSASSTSVDMALAVGAKKLHEGRQFMYDKGKKYNSQFLDSATGLCKAEFLEERACPVCGFEKYCLLFIRGGGRYAACQRCGMVFLNPVFTDRALADFYSGNTTIQADVILNESDFYRSIYIKGLATISDYIETGIIMDIGCSSGFFLDIAKAAGWKTMGIELNRSEAAMAQKKHEIHNTSIFSLDRDVKCDAITMWDVFEHMKDGNKILRLLSKRYLKKGGVIFFQVPNARSLAARILQEKCKMFDGIEHVNIYDPNTMALVAENNGLEVLHLETVISEIPIIANYLDYQDPYLGEVSHGGKILGLLDEKTLHKNLLGYKMQVVLRSR